MFLLNRYTTLMAKSTEMFVRNNMCPNWEENVHQNNAAVTDSSQSAHTQSNIVRKCRNGSKFIR